MDSPKYTSKRLGEVPYLDTSAAYDDGTLVLNVVNRHETQAIETDFDLADKQFAGPLEVAEVNGPDIKAENTFGSTKVSSAKRSATAQGHKLRYRFSPHSYTMLKGKLA